MVKPLTVQWSVAVVVQRYQGQQHNSRMNDDAIVCNSMRMIFAVLSSMGRDSLYVSVCAAALLYSKTERLGFFAQLYKYLR